MRVKRCGWLVRNQQLRASDDRLSHEYSLALASAELVWPCGEDPFRQKSCIFQGSECEVAMRARITAAPGPRRFHHLAPGRKHGVQRTAGLLKNRADPRSPILNAALNTRAGRQCTKNCKRQSRFPRTGRTSERHHLAGLDLQIDIVENMPPGIRNRDATQP